MVQVRAPPLQTTRSVRSVRVRLELDLSRILSNAKQCRVCIVCSTRNSNYSHVDSFTSSYSRVALPGPSESVYRRATRTAHSTRACGLDRHSRHATRLLDCGLLELNFSPHSRSPLSVFVGRATAIPGLTALRRALCSLGARTGVLPRGVLTSNVVRCASTVPSTSCWDLGGAVSHFVSSENKSRTVEYKSAAADAPTMSMIYVARPRRSPITNY